MEEFNKIMLEKGYKPILVFKYGVNNANPKQIDELIEKKKAEYVYLSDKYTLIFLCDLQKKLFEESVEIMNPFVYEKFRITENVDYKFGCEPNPHGINDFYHK